MDKFRNDENDLKKKQNEFSFTFSKPKDDLDDNL